MTYIEEVDRLIQMMKEDSALPEYFTALFRKGKLHPLTGERKKIGVLGDPFYALYARAFGLDAININGGSYYTGDTASSIFPQISDPVAKAAVGLLLEDDGAMLKKLDAVLVSSNNDSYKKSCYYLRQYGVPIIEVEPPSYVLAKMPFSYVWFQLKMLDKISKVANSNMDSRTLRTYIQAYHRAHGLMEQESFKTLPTLVQNFIQETFDMAKKKNLWCEELEKFLLTVTPAPIESKVTIIGSQLQLPNSKVHEILLEIGVAHFENQCVSLAPFHEIPVEKSSMKLLNECFKAHYRHSFSARTLGGGGEIQFSPDTKAIIYYLLKGQTSEAYHVERMEEAALKRGLPFLCVETDYTNTDKEQMKIRMEAFHEMLRGASLGHV